MKILRRGIALVLSITLMFSLVAVVASPNWGDGTSLGLLSRYYETGNTSTDVAAAKMISTVDGDPGGKSYGAYMFASKTKTVKAFIDWCRNPAYNATNTVAYAIGEKLAAAYYSNGEGCGPLFDQAWLDTGDDYGRSFFTVQEAYAKTQIYDKAIDMITSDKAGKNFDIDNYSVALQNVIWSRAVHHGPEGAKNIVIKAFKSLGGFANQSEGELIMAIYDESGRVVTPEELKTENSATGAATMSGSTAEKYNVDGSILRYWYGSSSRVQLSVYRRLNVNEPADALNLMQQKAFNVATLNEGNYRIYLKTSNSKLALGMTEHGLKTVNTSSDGVPAKFTLNYFAGLDAYTISTTVPDGESGTKTLRLSVSTSKDGFGTVTLSEPSTDKSQLWSINGDGELRNLKTRTYLSLRHDSLVTVDDKGVSSTLTSIATISAADKTETFSLAVATPASSETSGNTPPATDPIPQTEGSDGTEALPVTGETPITEGTPEEPEEKKPESADKKLSITFVIGENGSFDESSTASFVAGETSDFMVENLYKVTGKNDWTFSGWFTEDGTEFKVGTTLPAGELTLYARYTATSKISPAEWKFSPVVADVSDFTVLHLIYPNEDTKLHENDSSFPVRGMISCSDKISTVSLKISGPDTLSASASPKTYSYDLSAMDSDIPYSSLKEGEYTYTLKAKVNGTNHLLKQETFYVDKAESSSSDTGDSVTVTFDAGKHGTCTTVSKAYELEDVVYGNLPSVKPDKYWGFAGWFTAEGVEILPGTQIIEEDITLYAKYTKVYTYTFLKPNGDTYESGSAATGTVFTAPSTAPTKAPDSDYTYKFSHWVNEDGEKYASSQAIVMSEDDMTFTPVYTKKTRPSDSESGSGGSGGDSETKPSSAYWTLTPGVSISQMEGTVYSNGKVVTDGSLATGMIVKVDGEEFVISVTGDMSGDGKITVTDVVKLQSHLLNKTCLSGAYLEAADLNGDSKVSITDLVKSARVVAGKDTIG